MSKIKIIGDIGIEKHVLVNSLEIKDEFKISKSVATNILSIEEKPGGSVAFALLAAERMGIEASVITCLGKNDEYSDKILQWLNKRRNIQRSVIRKENTNFFLSLWDTSGNKKLYFKKNNELKIEDILTSEEIDFQSVIIYESFSAETIKLVLEYYHKAGVFVSWVPNQTILQFRNQLKLLLPYIDIFFLNEWEMKEFLGLDDFDKCIKSLQEILSFSPKTIICLTRGQKGFLIITNVGDPIIISVSTKVRFVLGGGDILSAAVTILKLKYDDLEMVCSEAEEITSALVREIAPFQKYFS